MKRLSAAFFLVLFLLATVGCRAEELTAITDSFSIVLPENITALTFEEAQGSAQLRPVLEAVSSDAENLYIGVFYALGGANLSAVYIIQREKEAAAATGVANIGTYADTNEFALGLAEWYRLNCPDFYVVDVLSGEGGAPVFVVHAASEGGTALLGETYSTDYSDTVIAVFFDENGAICEPTQEQYAAFAAMLETIAVK